MHNLKSYAVGSVFPPFTPPICVLVLFLSANVIYSRLLGFIAHSQWQCQACLYLLTILAFQRSLSVVTMQDTVVLVLFLVANACILDFRYSLTSFLFLQSLWQMYMLMVLISFTFQFSLSAVMVQILDSWHTKGRTSRCLTAHACSKPTICTRSA